jgi:hypothetical protein
MSILRAVASTGSINCGRRGDRLYTLSPCRFGDDPAAEQNAKGENAASGEIEPGGPGSFHQHRRGINRQKKENTGRVPEWESWRDDSSQDSTSDTRDYRADCSENHLSRIGIDRDLTDQDVERKNGSGGQNQISADNGNHTAEGEKESARHVEPYVILHRRNTAAGAAARSFVKLR